MKILMTADTLGGVWTYCLELTKALAPHGVEVVLATMGRRPSSQQKDEAARLPNLRLYESEFKLEWMDEPWQDVDQAGQWLLDLERREQPDIIHLNGYSHGAQPWQAPVLVVGHSCLLSWWQAVKGEAAPEKDFVEYHRRVRLGLHAAQLVAAPTCAMLRALCNHYGTLPHAAVVANGRDSRLFKPGTKSPMLFTASRLWDESKNIDLLRRVELRLPWPLHVAGDESGPDGRGRAATMQHRLGRLNETQLADWLGRASIFVLPARYEPFGLSVLEAALSGCALVLGDIDSLHEGWGDAAVYVPPDDPDELLLTVTALAQDSNSIERLGAAARERGLQLNLERMADGYMALYRRLQRDRTSPCRDCLSLPPRSLRPPTAVGSRPRTGHRAAARSPVPVASRGSESGPNGDGSESGGRA